MHLGFCLAVMVDQIGKWLLQAKLPGVQATAAGIRRDSYLIGHA